MLLSRENRHVFIKYIPISEETLRKESCPDGTFDRESCHEMVVFLPGQISCLVRSCRPAVTPGSQALRQENKAVSLIEEPLDGIASPATEQEQGPGLDWIEAITEPDDGSETRDSAAHVCPACQDENPFDLNTSLKHGAQLSAGPPGMGQKRFETVRSPWNPSG